jgi:hypothetical protein
MHNYQSKRDRTTLDALNRLDNLSATKTKSEATLTLLENGMILHCNEVAANFLACAPSKLVWQPISGLFPQLAGMLLILDDEVNPNLKFLSLSGYYFEGIDLNDSPFASELFFSVVEDLGKHRLKVVIQPVRPGQAM